MTSEISLFQRTDQIEEGNAEISGPHFSFDFSVSLLTLYNILQKVIYIYSLAFQLSHLCSACKMNMFFIIINQYLIRT